MKRRISLAINAEKKHCNCIKTGELCVLYSHDNSGCYYFGSLQDDENERPLRHKECRKAEKE